MPGSISIWAGGVPSHAGWFLGTDEPILLTDADEEVLAHLYRIGYDNLPGQLAGGMLAWHMSGIPSSSVRTLTVQTLCEELDSGREPFLVDVRSPAEVEESGTMPGAINLQLH